MAIRLIREKGDPILNGTAKPIKELTPRISALIEDMFETMYDAYGVGLAGPQVGIRKRIFVVDAGGEKPCPYVFINPEIIETSGSQTGDEGCLSVPGKHGVVTRPSYVKIKALDAQFKPFELEAQDLLARAILHENDHLDGILYTSKVEGELLDNQEE